MIKDRCFSRISLNTLTLNVKSDKVYTRHGVPISVTGIAQVSLVPRDTQMFSDEENKGLLEGNLDLNKTLI